MKKRLTIKKRAAIFSVFMIIVALLLSIECNVRFPKDITIFKGENLLVSSSSPYTISTPAAFGGVLEESGELTKDSFSSNEKYVTANDTGKYSASVKLFGIIPVRNVNINVSDTKMLIPGGNTIGIKMFTEGLLCVGISDIADKKGNIVNLANQNGIETGDIFISANGKNLRSTEQFAKLVSESDGEAINLTIDRNGKTLTKNITPLLTNDGYKIGIWVRDSTAGIGTLSFTDPETGTYGALGHAICDSDTGMLMPVSDGAIVSAEVFGVQKGEKGTPGELKGTFTKAAHNLGTIEKNTTFGIFGKLSSENSETDITPIPIASKNMIKKGKAQIISNVNGTESEIFDIEIQRILTFGGNDNKNMIIKVTDSDLLEKTGGIVQGMSGSPIIQNGKLVGAVTHVFVNDPTRGYGVFIENMLIEAEKNK